MQKMDQTQFTESFPYLKKNTLDEIRREKSRNIDDRSRNIDDRNTTNLDDRNTNEEESNRDEPFNDQWVNEFITIQKWNEKKDQLDRLYTHMA